MKVKKNAIVFMALLFSLAFTACTNKQGVTDYSNQEQALTDYSTPEHWLSLHYSAVKEVDIFYLYPTSWQKIDSTESNICAINNPLMLKYSRYAFERQATAFETVGNIYAPYYRQMDVASRAFMTTEEQEKFVAGIPTLDAIAAFDYYIKHYNNGRPFILAGHSQGANILANILSGYLKDNQQVYSRMIAAYVIGYSITGEYLNKNPHLKFAEGPDDIGVIISYNTEAPEVVKGTNPVTLPGGIAINPITWTREETLATADKNLGSIILNKDGSVAAGIPIPVMNYADARIDKNKGVVICSTADVSKLSPGTAGYVRGVYHSFDFPFYYYNIRENAANRTKKFLNK
ncbi:MAG: DUF3089 domain-containing protein [Ignavibacteriales bacterium]|nr:DUF3089 domain-containing protein [Ignavibacteriales bacterium]